jgi:hypothetical protein
MYPVVVTLRPHPLSLDSTLPHFLEGLKLNESGFAIVLHVLHELHELLLQLLQLVHLLHAAAPVIDMTKKTSIKILSAFNIVFCIIYILLGVFNNNSF